MMKTIAVLGVVSAIFAATATPTLAKTNHNNGAYGAYGQVIPPPSRAPLMQELRGFHQPSMTWDAYGLRWDGGN
jgi:hypothetical protein